MALFPRVTVWVSNQVLTASALNGEFNNILNNAQASSWVGFSTNVSQMQQQASPGGVGTESLAGSISDELQRLRFMFAYALGKTYWYDQTGRNFGAGNLAVQTADYVDASITLAKLAATVVPVPTGMISPFAGTSAPTGFLMCDGAPVSRTTYATLFATIGVAYGQGDNSTTFNVPDLRGKFLRGYMPLVSLSPSGSASGNQVTCTAHGLNRSGVKVTVLGTPVTGLTVGVTYYIIYVDANTVGFATTLANAVAGTLITISGSAGSMIIRVLEDVDGISRERNAPGANTGNNVGAVQDFNTSAVPLGVVDFGHQHLIEVGNAGGAIQGLSGSSLVGDTITGAATSFAHTGSATTGIGISGGSETRPQNMVVNYLIKT
jgi:microcystin-dependent protein